MERVTNFHFYLMKNVQCTLSKKKKTSPRPKASGKLPIAGIKFIVQTGLDVIWWSWPAQKAVCASQSHVHPFHHQEIKVSYRYI
jgi:hypothetical protein